jgi:alpha,alpha-trehalase
MHAGYATNEDVASLRAYIHDGWTKLRRTHAQMLVAAVDSKLPSSRSAWPVYVSVKEDLAAVQRRIASALSPAEFAKLDVRRLPADPSKLTEHGLLYLPEPYVVPGGRFNEMYGWDSYFILLGLLQDRQIDLAKSMVDNSIYQIEHYGAILNANRTYYLSRSQPPFLTLMVREVYHRTRDKAWLASTMPAIETYYRYWMTEPHVTPETGLSRYHDLGQGPAPEVVASERDLHGNTHYDRVREFYRTHPVDDYDVTRFYDAEANELTELFYLADRSMRESGFDPSARFGRFNARVISTNPVCLNTLLWKMETDIAKIAAELGHDPAPWKIRASNRHRVIDTYLWDPEHGLYLDYDFESKTTRHYPFGTMFFPLWAGLASADQAKKIAGNLHVLEHPGGLAASARKSDTQWDLPYGWAPLQLIAAEGLRRYGYEKEADRVSINFLSLVLKEFLQHGAIFEKYDVVERGSQTNAKFGYLENVVGFGWTNAVWTSLYDTIRPGYQDLVKLLDGVGTGQTHANRAAAVVISPATPPPGGIGAATDPS